MGPRKNPSDVSLGEESSTFLSSLRLNLYRGCDEAVVSCTRLQQASIMLRGCKLQPDPPGTSSTCSITCTIPSSSRVKCSRGR